jgi:Fe2+ transport system protein FeoA
MNLRIKEVAINWTHVDGSKVDLLRDSFGMFWNIIQIRFIFGHHRDASPVRGNLNIPVADEKLFTLSSMSLGQKALIMAYNLETEDGERIQKMGLVPSERFEVVRLPPQGESVEIKIRGYFVSLRKEEADRIMVKFLK